LRVDDRVLTIGTTAIWPHSYPADGLAFRPNCQAYYTTPD
jgi:hypothetical protein